MPPASVAVSPARMPSCHACHTATHTLCYAFPLPCMPPPCISPFATHAPLHHVCRPFATHAAPLPHMTLCHTHTIRHTPPLWTEGMIHACENITFLQLLLWAVKKWTGVAHVPSDLSWIRQFTLLLIQSVFRYDIVLDWISDSFSQGELSLPPSFIRNTLIKILIFVPLKMLRYQPEY